MSTEQLKPMNCTRPSGPQYSTATKSTLCGRELGHARLRLPVVFVFYLLLTSYLLEAGLTPITITEYGKSGYVPINYSLYICEFAVIASEVSIK